ncbi:hypothetical protein JCM24511_09964 [Saitozyma sp. JCM 24511]|nr:hypothetical protein JCM24511_09964 [Saitozyma sp. JCM 24511]
MSASLLSAALLGALALAPAGAIAADAPAPTITPKAVYADLGARQASTTTYETTSPLPLTEYFYPYSAIPYKVNPYAVGRGPQSGYNQCNSTTEGASSQCQTGVFNSIEDFCFWGAPGTTPNQTIGDVEAAVVAYFMKTEAYIQIVGFFNQTSINLASDDSGGELDPHGADYLGNPLGGLFYSTGFASGDNTTYVQTQSWNNFVGSNQFCLKLCDPGYSTDLNYCQNIFDLIGCEYNMPADYATLQSEGLFISCEGDLQDEVGTYTSNGQTYTWSQPSSLPATSTLPWTPRVPASSNCVTYSSSDLFPTSDLGYAASVAALGASASGSVASKSASGSASASKASGASSSRTGSGSASGASSTASASAKSAGWVTLPNAGMATVVAAVVAAFFA